MPDKELTKLLSESVKKDTVNIAGKDVKTGVVFVTDDTAAQKAVQYSHSSVVSKKEVDKDGEPWSEKEYVKVFGLETFIVKKQIFITPFKVTETIQYTDYATVKADNPISIKFFGSTADDAQVNVSTTKDLYLTGDVGNRQLYEKDGIYSEKGKVTLNSNDGSIIRKGYSIYANEVDLVAAKDLSNINISAGNTVGLTGNFNGVANITVEGTYGGGVGNVLLYDLGNNNATKLTLTAAGNIVQYSADNLLSAKQINLDSKGSVSGQNGTLLYLRGGQAVDVSSIDISDASVSIRAKDDIKICQKTGNLRVGKIYSTEGDLLIYVPDGAIVDALPADEGDLTASEKDLVKEWERAGVIKSDGKGWGAIQAVQKSAKEAAARYAEKVENEYSVYQELQQRAADYAGKKGGYQEYLNTAKDEYALYQGLCKEYAEYQELCKNNSPLAEEKNYQQMKRNG